MVAVSHGRGPARVEALGLHVNDELISRPEVYFFQRRLSLQEDGVVKIQVHFDPALFDRDSQVEFGILGTWPLGSHRQLVYELDGLQLFAVLAHLIIPVPEGIFGDLFLGFLGGGAGELALLFVFPYLTHVN